MKRILNVSYFSSLRLKNCYINDVNKKISNGLIRNGYEVINYSDRDICRFLGLFRRKNFVGKIKLQKHFYNFCVSYKPDAIVMCHADTIKPETIAKVKNSLPNVKILQYNIDAICPSLPNGLANAEKIKTKIDVIDATVLTTADKKMLKQFERNGKFVGYIPNPADKSIEKSKMFEIENPEFDILFGGTQSKRQFCGEEVSYMDIIDLVKESVKDIKLKVFGLNKKNKIEGPEYQAAYESSAIGLNLSTVNDNYLYSSDRMAHIMGNGLLCFIDRSTGFSDIFKEDEVAFYSTKEEFLEKLEYYKNNPKQRMAVAKKGYNKYYKHFNEQQVTKYITDILFDTLDEDNYIWTKILKEKK